MRVKSRPFPPGAGQLAQIVVFNLVVCIDEQPSKHPVRTELKHEQTKENSETIQIYTIQLGSIFTIPQGNTARQGPVSQFVFEVLKQEERFSRLPLLTKRSNCNESVNENKERKRHK